MTKNKNILFITNIIMGILVIILGGFIIIDKVFINKGGSNNDKEVVENESNYVISDIITKSVDDEYKIFYTKDSKIVVVSSNVKETVVTDDVSNYYKVHVGMSDICIGNEFIIIEKNDGTILAFSSDRFVCGNTIYTKDITEDLKKLGITSLKRVYENASFTSEYEPLMYQVFAVNQNSEIIDITNIFEE
ncbi:MAG: hypothetical protein ACI4XM_05210 [Candidatus Coprovivens sp.]